MGLRPRNRFSMSSNAAMMGSQEIQTGIRYQFSAAGRCPEATFFAKYTTAQFALKIAMPKLDCVDSWDHGDPT
jgi:hypothetical protein